MVTVPPALLSGKCGFQIYSSVSKKAYIMYCNNETERDQWVKLTQIRIEKAQKNVIFFKNNY